MFALRTLITLLILAKYSIDDIKTKEVNIAYIAAFSLIGALLMLVTEISINGRSIFETFISLILSITPGILLLIVSKLVNGFGEGDAYIFLMIGAVCGIKATLISLYMSFILAGLYAFYLCFFKKKDKGSRFAFVPFILAGFILCAVLGMFIEMA